MKGPIIFVDIETTGLAPTAEIIQVAAIAVSHWREIGIFERKIRFDESKAEPGVLAMNSYDPETWARAAIAEATAVGDLGRFLDTYRAVTLVSKRGKPYTVARLAGHNALGFDAPRLQAAFQRHGAFFAADVYRPLDTVQLALWCCARTNHTPADYKLETLCAHFGVPLTDGHDALSDVRATIALARKLMEVS